VSVTAPPRPPEPTDPNDRTELEALIEEARRRARRRRQRYAAAVLAALLAGLAVYVGVARDSGAGTRVVSDRSGSAAVSGPARNGELTILTMDVPDQVHGVPAIRTLDLVGGRSSRVLWRCPAGVVCNQAVSFAWAPDGRRVAFSLDQIGGTSFYTPGLHVVDVTTGRDRQIPSGAPTGPTDAKTFPPYRRKIMQRVGCWPAADLAWSPDGKRLAYGCDLWDKRRSFIGVLDLEGAGFRAIPTTGAPRWPAWSADGTRLAYSTEVRPSTRSSVHVVRLDGTHRRLVARNAAAPAWSPDGRTIAYWGACGIRFVTPAGRDVTPRRTRSAGCDATGPSGPPVWSPDGRKLAVEVSHGPRRPEDGVYVMDADGSNVRRVSLDSALTWYGQMPGRPSWRPVP
jgi:Tol biopolymer transport system component